MRYFMLLGLVCLPALGFGQAGNSSTPFAPRVSTPSFAFATPQLQVGASNATEGNVVGASAMIPAATSEQSPRAGGFNTGASIPEGAVGLAQLTAGRTPAKAASRKFTNSDVERLHGAEPQ